jgi:predicted nucleic acid-binding Zn ribbon protein
MEGSTDPRAPADTTCPSCDAPAQPGQLVCLECGTRLELDYKRPRGWKLPVAVVLAVVLVAAGAFAIAISRVSDDAESEVADAPAGAEERQTEEEKRQPGEDKETRTGEGRERREPRERPRERPRPPERRAARTDPRARTWPAGRDGFTVVLISTEDQASARQFARTARQGGTSVGVLRSDDYPSLQRGFWIVFSGVYKGRPEAERAANRLNRGFPGSFPQFVNGTKAKRR